MKTKGCCKLFVWLILLSFLFSCSSSNESATQDQSYLGTHYFTSITGSYLKGALPQTTGSASVGTVTISGSVIAGGLCIVNITPSTSLSELYVTADDSNTDGYYKIPLSSSSASNGSYTLYLQMSRELNKNFVIKMAALTTSGQITAWLSKTLHYVKAGTGELQVSLTFDKSKDLDLYLVEPNGHIIYYEDSLAYLYKYRDRIPELAQYINDTRVNGLDLDSNAGCRVDGINNENISIYKEFMQAGSYQVWVNEYQNCDPTCDVQWAVSVLYQGNLVTPDKGPNPATGSFDKSFIDNKLKNEILTNSRAVKVMEFSIADGVIVKSSTQNMKARDNIASSPNKKEK